MKKLIGLVVGMVLLASCQPNQLQDLDYAGRIAGDYSYKISGIAVVNGDSVRLEDEIGAMEIVRIDSVKALVTFNALNGPAYYTYMEVDGQELSLEPYERNLRVNLADYAIVGFGEGTVYDKTILIDLQYEMQQASANGLTAEKLTVLCKKN